MRKENVEFLEAHYDCYREVVNAETAVKAKSIDVELLRIMNEEFLPGYAYSEGCGSCLFDMVRIIYRYYDEWKAKQPKKELIIEASFPANSPDDETIHAKPKNHRRK